MKMETINKLKEDINTIIENHALNSYLRSNLNKQGKLYKKHIPYTLCDETLSLLEILKNLNNKEITKETEEIAKGTLLKYKLLKPEFLEKANGRTYILS